MAYRALYRQWRPETFSQMVGQKSIIDSLRNQVITGRVAHAYLFCGSRGTGKTSTAKILARAINCENPNNGDPCGECMNCIRAANEETLDIIEIDAASNNGVDEMRDLRETVKYPPQYGSYKVYIIDEVHMLSTSAFNALLKTLEEPPAHIVFILATTEPQKLPATILSRCQRFDFGRLSVPEILGRLREATDQAGVTASDGALMQIARAAEGGMRDALSILDICMGFGQDIDEILVRRVLGTSDRSFLVSFAGAVFNRNAAKVFALVDELMRGGRDPSVFAKEFSSHIRSLLIARCSGEDVETVLDITREDAEDLIRQAEGVTITRLMKTLDIFLALETEMRYSATPRIALENACLKCCLRIDDADNQAISDRLEEIENRLESVASGTVIKKNVRSARSVPPAGGGDTGEAHLPEKKELPAAGNPVWEKAYETIKRNEPAVAGLLSLGKFGGCSGNEYIWYAGDAGTRFVGPLNSEPRNKKIADILSETAGVPCTFRAADRPTQKKDTGTAVESREIDPFVEVFGKEAVTVVDDIPR